MEDKDIEKLIEENRKLKGANQQLDSRVADLEEIVKPKHNMKLKDPSVCLTTSALIPNGRKCEPKDIEKFVDNVKKRLND
jgi:hypothetical protein